VSDATFPILSTMTPEQRLSMLAYDYELIGQQFSKILVSKQDVVWALNEIRRLREQND